MIKSFAKKVRFVERFEGTGEKIRLPWSEGKGEKIRLPWSEDAYLKFGIRNYDYLDISRLNLPVDNGETLENLGDLGPPGPPRPPIIPTGSDPDDPNSNSRNSKWALVIPFLTVALFLYFYMKKTECPGQRERTNASMLFRRNDPYCFMNF